MQVINIYYGNWDTCPSKSGAQPPATSAAAAPAAAAAVDLLDALTTFNFRETPAGTAGRRLAAADDSEEDLPGAGEDEENETRPGGSGQNGTTGPVARRDTNPWMPAGGRRDIGQSSCSIQKIVTCRRAVPAVRRGAGGLLNVP
jgi:hypothetical protein